MAAARVVSLLFQPAVSLTALLAALTIKHPAWRGDAAVLWLALAALPAAILGVGLRLRVWSDAEVTSLRERRTFLPVAAALALAVALVAVRAPYPYGLRVVAVSIALWLVASAVVSLAWKISLHAGATVGAVLLTAWLLGGAVAAAFAWAPFLVAWSRLRLGRHTPAQLVAGAVAATAAFALALRLVAGPP